MMALSEHQTGSRGLFWLGVCVLSIFFIINLSCLYGCFQILTGGLVIKDTSVTTVVFGLICTINGYVASSATQVLSYFFGSSKGSADKTAAMADAMRSPDPVPVTDPVTPACVNCVNAQTNPA